MKLGLSCVDVAFSPKPSIDIDLVKHAEALGFDSAWTGEAYGCDAVSMATWIAAHTSTIKIGTAILQMPARSPAMAAMTAIGLDALSKGRFILGLGSSGPRVAEGWHSVTYDKPLTRTREYVEIVRKILAREAPVSYQGYHYQLPMSGGNATGLGKPFKTVANGNPTQAIYLASISPGGLRCAAHIGDGVLLAFFSPQHAQEAVGKYLCEGFDKSGAHTTRDRFTVSSMVNVVLSEDLEKAQQMMKVRLAAQLGGMGAKSKNFYAEYAARFGYADEVERVQTLFLKGERDKAVAAVPTQLVDDINLLGPVERIKERLVLWREAGRRGDLDLMLIATQQPQALELLAEELL